MKLDDDLALPTPLTSTTPVPRLRAASASRRVVENLKSLRNKMEPSGAAVERGDTHTPSSSTSFSDPYAFTTQHQPVYSPPHLPRSQTWSHSESSGFVQQNGDGGSGIVSDTNTNTDNDTGTCLDHGHGSGYALHGSSTSADAYGPSPDDDGYNARRGQDLQSFRRIRHNNNEDTFDNSRDIDTSLLVPNNSDSPGSGSDPGVECVNVNGHRHIHLNSSPRRSQSSLARLLNFSGY
ncbi:hypothetical protein GGU10DRAFT_71023 [Lentinula aff. detonsa]|uniref:Uncharacterized protein n=1 Tax=Lentinula aff. detonsa TaxID=2804958 RepID=A0AA38NQB4_9AGAR|nr:hypothetical protein GGU10DRAFT_71023 [Lentinula aff. detonsa]